MDSGSERKCDPKALCKLALESQGSLERWELGSYLEYVFIYTAPVCVPSAML